MVVGIGILLLVSAYESKNKNLLIYWVFIVASHDIDFQQIIKWALFLHLGVLLFVIGSSYGGIVENQIYIPVSYTHLDVYKRQAVYAVMLYVSSSMYGSLRLGYFRNCLLYTSRCV